jgi:hypothetical protein
MKRTCRQNPQLPPHEHHRKDGFLICEGYQEMIQNERFLRARQESFSKFEALKKAFPDARYIPE